MSDNEGNFQLFTATYWQAFSAYCSVTQAYLANLQVKKKMKCCEYGPCAIKNTGWLFSEKLVPLLLTVIFTGLDKHTSLLRHW